MDFHGHIPRSLQLSAALFVCLTTGIQSLNAQTDSSVASEAAAVAKQVVEEMLPFSVLRSSPTEMSVSDEGEPTPASEAADIAPIVGEPTPAKESTSIEPVAQEPTPAVAPAPAIAVNTPEPAPTEEHAAPTKSPSGDLRSLAFHDVEPGLSTYEQVLEAWGEPLQESEHNGQLWLTYATSPFKQVDVRIEDDLVSLIIIHLREPASPTHVADQIGVSEYRPVAIPNRHGKVLGQAFPEVGVAFNFADDSDQFLVAQIFLEPVDAEPFVLRAEYDFHRRYESDLKDLEIALSIDPEHAHAHWLAAQRLMACGDETAALEHAEEAVRLQPEVCQYGLTRAALMGRNGRRSEAEAEIRKLLACEELEAEIEAMAHNHLARLLEEGTLEEQAAALEQHLAAIRIALPLAENSEFAIRRLAKQVLIDSHLHASMIVSHGEFRNKDQALDMWLSRSKLLIEDYIAGDKGDPLLWLQYQEAALAADTRLEQATITHIAERATQHGQELSESNSDALYQRSVHQAWGQVMLAAMSAEAVRGNLPEALKYAQQARDHLSMTFGDVEPSYRQSAIMAELCFASGTLLFQNPESEADALVWYDEAQQYLDSCQGVESLLVQHHMGSWRVAMGAAYWKAGRQQQAVELTRRGIDDIQHAVAGGAAEEDSLVAPCQNLAAMYRSLGEPEKAEESLRLAELPLSFEETGTTQR